MNAPASAVLASIPGIREVLDFIADAYEGHLRRHDHAVEHPIAVAALLAQAGEPPHVVISGLLHDVLEDTHVTAEELMDRFGSEVGRTVAALTQDDRLGRYRQRKAALREQILDAGPLPAKVTLADKLAKLEGAHTRPRRRRLEHYRATLEGVEARYGQSVLGERLRAQLDRWPAS